MKVEDFHYELPERSIAQDAVEPRHDSRLLDTRDLSDHRFLDLADLLDPGDLIVVNSTKVRAARLVGSRVDTGGRVELLLLDRDQEGSWKALARPARRLRPGVVVDCDGIEVTVLTDPADGVVAVSLEAEDDESVIERIGSVPLPPYFSGSLDSSSRYQTVYADKPGSAAAPTAGLHFTSEVFDRLKQRGIDTASVDLHVSLDTFRPMAVESIEDHVMHSEWCSITEEAAEAINGARRVVAVGTTVVRTLESMATGQGSVRAGSHHTDLFITPGFEIRVVDLLITNFHMPSSTLLVLLAGFMGESWQSAYDTALERSYRFLSFGDAMLAERKRP